MKYSEGTKVVPISKTPKGFADDFRKQPEWIDALKNKQNFLYVNGTLKTAMGEEVYLLSNLNIPGRGNFYLESDVKMYNKYNATEKTVKFLNNLEELQNAYKKFTFTSRRIDSKIRELTVLKRKLNGRLCVVTSLHDNCVDVINIDLINGEYTILTSTFASVDYFLDEYTVVSQDAVTFLKDLFTKDLEAEKKKKEITDVINDLKKKLDEATKKLDELSK